MSKEIHRKFYRKIRMSLDPDVTQRYSEVIALKIKSLLRNQGFSGTLFAYKALKGEPDLLPFLYDERFHVALPRVQIGSDMRFYLWSPQEPLIESSLGILEPPEQALEMLPTAGDVALVPAIAIDVKGQRLGFGGGYYDRWLSANRSSLRLVIGVVFPPCFSPAPFEVEPHDMSVDLCITGEQYVNVSDTLDLK